MGLLYVNGERLHDDDAELIERAREQRRTYIAPAAIGDDVEERYRPRDCLAGMSFAGPGSAMSNREREFWAQYHAEKARADQSTN